METACTIAVNVDAFVHDEDTLLYLEQLRVALVDAYSPITQGVIDSNSQQIYQQFMDKLFAFLEAYITIDRSAEIYKSVAGLIGDLAACQGVQVAPHVN